MRHHTPGQSSDLLQIFLCQAPADAQGQPESAGPDGTAKAEAPEHSRRCIVLICIVVVLGVEYLIFDYGFGMAMAPCNFTGQLFRRINWRPRLRFGSNTQELVVQDIRLAILHEASCSRIADRVITLLGFE